MTGFSVPYAPSAVVMAGAVCEVELVWRWMEGVACTAARQGTYERHLGVTVTGRCCEIATVQQPGHCSSAIAARP